MRAADHGLCEVVVMDRFRSSFWGIEVCRAGSRRESLEFRPRSLTPKKKWHTFPNAALSVAYPIHARHASERLRAGRLQRLRRLDVGWTERALWS